MKSLTTISVQGDEQQALEVYTDDTREQTFGFIFDEGDAGKVEQMLLVATETGRTPRQLADDRAALLEACKALEDAWGDGGEVGDWRGALDHALRLASNAIARAEGVTR